jgi:hypothetical protein
MNVEYLKIFSTAAQGQDFGGSPLPRLIFSRAKVKRRLDLSPYFHGSRGVDENTVFNMQKYRGDRISRLLSSLYSEARW